MRGVLDWILAKMRLVDEEAEDEQEAELVPKEYVKPRFLVMYRRSTENYADQYRVFLKRVQSYDDCKEIIENYKTGSVCIFLIDQVEKTDAQGMLNYICGGIYVLQGEVSDLGHGVFVTVEIADICSINSKLR